MDVPLLTDPELSRLLEHTQMPFSKRFGWFALAMIVAASCSKDPEAVKRLYVESGDRYMAEKKYAEAIIQYRNAVATDERFGEARFKLATAYRQSGDLSAALREFVRAADLMPDNVNAQLRAATFLVAAGQFADAQARATSALAKEPKNAEALVILGNALAGLRDLDGAISQIEQAIDANPQVTFSYANLGWLESKKGNATAAEGAFKRAIEIAPKSVAARLNLANFYWASRRRDEAEREMKAALEIDQKSTDANRLLAAFYVTNNQAAEAGPYIKAFAENSSDVEPKVALADYYLARGNTTEATAVLQELAKNSEGFVAATLRLAAIDFDAGRRPQAFAALDSILARYKDAEPALEAKARFLMLEGRNAEALTVADAVVQANPNAVRTHFLRGRVLRQLGRISDAVAALQRTLELAPASVIAQGALAELHLANRNPQAALNLTGQVVKAQPRSPAAHFLHARALLESGNHVGATPIFESLVKLAPKSAELQTWLGRAYMAREDFKAARQAFTRASELEPKSIYALNGLVTLDVVERKPGAARATLDKEIAADPENTALLYLAANTFLTLGDTRRAEGLLQDVLRLDPSHLDAYNKLGSLYVSEGRLDEAKQKYVDALGREQPNKSRVTTLTLAGIVFELQNNPQEAMQQYEKALELDPRAAVAANNLAWIHTRDTHQLDRALDLAQTAKAGLPEHPNVSNTLGWVYYQRGFYTRAISSLRESVDQAPMDPVKHYFLGLAYLKNAQKVEARAALQQALDLDPKFAYAQLAKEALATLRDGGQ